MYVPSPLSQHFWVPGCSASHSIVGGPEETLNQVLEEETLRRFSVIADISAVALVYGEKKNVTFNKWLEPGSNLQVLLEDMLDKLRCSVVYLFMNMNLCLEQRGDNIPLLRVFSFAT